MASGRAAHYIFLIGTFTTLGRFLYKTLYQWPVDQLSANKTKIIEVGRRIKPVQPNDTCTYAQFLEQCLICGLGAAIEDSQHGEEWESPKLVAFQPGFVQQHSWKISIMIMAVVLLAYFGYSYFRLQLNGLLRRRPAGAPCNRVLGALRYHSALLRSGAPVSMLVATLNLQINQAGTGVLEYCILDWTDRLFPSSESWIYICTGVFITLFIYGEACDDASALHHIIENHKFKEMDNQRRVKDLRAEHAKHSEKLEAVRSNVAHDVRRRKNLQAQIVEDNRRIENLQAQNREDNRRIKDLQAQNEEDNRRIKNLQAQNLEHNRRTKNLQVQYAEDKQRREGAQNESITLLDRAIEAETENKTLKEVVKTLESVVEAQKESVENAADNFEKLHAVFLDQYNTAAHIQWQNRFLYNEVCAKNVEISELQSRVEVTAEAMEKSDNKADSPKSDKTAVSKRSDFQNRQEEQAVDETDISNHKEYSVAMTPPPPASSETPSLQPRNPGRRGKDQGTMWDPVQQRERHICKYHGSAEGCRHGANCIFYHRPLEPSEAALPANSIERRKAVCRFFNSTDGCGKGVRCEFRHITWEQAQQEKLDTAARKASAAAVAATAASFGDEAREDEILTERMND